MSEEEESSTDLLHSLVTINDIPSLATLFLTLCDSKENAIKLLESIILEIDPIQEIKKKRPLVYDEDVIEQFTDEHSTKIPRPEDEKLSEIVENNIVDLYKNQVNVHDNNIERLDITFTDVIRDIYDDDASNESYLMTLAVLIPNDMGLSAYIIGKQGANVAEIRRKTKAKTQLEQPKLIPPGITERNIFFMGTVRGICEAYQHVFARIISKADTLPAGCLDDLRMVIPTELSALLIGKGGVSIKKIQSESGARTHLQSEDEMVQSGHYYGRILVISGTLRQRCHAMYLILKNVRSIFSIFFNISSFSCNVTFLMIGEVACLH